MAFVEGYTVFLSGKWDVPTFLFSYTMIGVLPALFVVWKVVHKTHVSLCLSHYVGILFKCGISGDNCMKYHFSRMNVW